MALFADSVFEEESFPCAVHNRGTEHEALRRAGVGSTIGLVF